MCRVLYNAVTVIWSDMEATQSVYVTNTAVYVTDTAVYVTDAAIHSFFTII